MTAGAMSYYATCRHCGRVIVTAARFADAELACLRYHARRCCPHDAPPDDADAGAILAHFDVERQP